MSVTSLDQAIQGNHRVWNSLRRENAHYIELPTSTDAYDNDEIINSFSECFGVA